MKKTAFRIIPVLLLIMFALTVAGTAIGDSQWVHVGASDHTFAKDAPLATIVIDYDVMNNPSRLRIDIPKSDTGFEKRFIKDFPGYSATHDKNEFVVYNLTLPDAKKLNKYNTLLGKGLSESDVAFVFTIEDAAVLPDGSTANVEISYSNVHIFLRSDADLEGLNRSSFSIASGILFRTGHNYHQYNETLDQKNVYGITAEAKIQVKASDGSVIEHVRVGDMQVQARFLFTVTDIDVFRSDGWYFGKIGEARANKNFSEQIAIDPEGLIARPEDGKKIYVPGNGEGTHVHRDNYVDTPEGVLFYPIANNPDPDPGTYHSGFIAVVDNSKGVHLKVTSSGSSMNNVRTYLFSHPNVQNELAQHQIKSVTDGGGTIRTTERGGDPNKVVGANGENVEEGDLILDQGTYNVPVGKTVTYTMRPRGFANSATRIKSIIIRGGVDGKDLDEANYEFTQTELLAMNKGDTKDVEFEHEEKTGELKYMGDGVYNFTFVENSYDHYIEVQWERYLTVRKVWDDAGHEDQRPEELRFKLVADNQVLDDSEVTIRRNADGTWPEYTFVGLSHDVGTYEVVEEKLDNYTRWPSSADQNGLMTMTNRWAPGLRNIRVRKIWDDANDQDGVRPDAVHVTLWRNGEPVPDSLVMLNEANGWEHMWENMPIRDENDNDYTYTVQEEDVPEGYECSVKGTEYGHFEVTNKHIPETIPVIGVRKNWEGGGTPPDVVYYRLHNGFVEEDVIVKATAAEDWIHRWHNLPKYRNGELLRYTVTEDVPPDSPYVPDRIDQTHNPRIITNRYDPDHVRVMVLIEWRDDGDRDGVRPDQVEVELIANGEPTGKKITVKKDDHWYGRFEKLDKWSSAGELIDYSVRGSSVDEYHQWPMYQSDITQDQNIFCIPYEHVSATRTIWVKKHWDDAGHENERPDHVTIRLYANGHLVRHKQMSKDVDWRAIEFADLPAFANGAPINYTITEDRNGPYSKHTHRINDSSFEVTNTYNPGKVSVEVLKAWYGHNDQDGLRPDSVTIHLLADGKDTGKTVILSDANQWHGVFEVLDQQKDGKDIHYTVSEDKIYGYDTTIDGSMETAFIVSNFHKPETVTYTINKIWVDSGNENKRPPYLTFNLYADGHPLMSREMLADEGWQDVVFRHLPVYAKGKKVNYVVTEDPVEDYNSELLLSEGKAINTYEKKDVPKTGDGMPLILWGGAALLGAAGAFAVGWRRRGRKKAQNGNNE